MEKLKKSRTASFIIIAIVYIIAAIAGIVTYKAMNFDWWLNLLIADIAATVVTFIFSVIFDNASVYDPYWSVQPIVILSAFAVGKEITFERALLLIAVFLWGIRLTANWAYTFHGLEHQDWRYTMLKEKTGVFYPIINFLGIHMVPTLIVYACITPAVYVFVHTPESNGISIIFFTISVGATLLQGVADFQMQSFRKHRDGTFNRHGLWHYSRHPNYLGEILMWWGVGLSATFMFRKVYLLIGAISNTLLFLGVSIPMADNRQATKQGFEDYKKQTRMLLPLKK